MNNLKENRKLHVVLLIAAALLGGWVYSTGSYASDDNGILIVQQVQNEGVVQVGKEFLWDFKWILLAIVSCMYFGICPNIDRLAEMLDEFLSPDEPKSDDQPEPKKKSG